MTEKIFDVYAPEADYDMLFWFLAILVGGSLANSQAQYIMNRMDPGGYHFIPRMQLTLAKHLCRTDQLAVDQGNVVRGGGLGSRGEYTDRGHVARITGGVQG